MTTPSLLPNESFTQQDKYSTTTAFIHHQTKKHTNAPKHENICCNYKGTENTHTKTPEYFMIRHPTSPLPLKQREEVTKNKVTAKI